MIQVSGSKCSAFSRQEVVSPLGHFGSSSSSNSNNSNNNNNTKQQATNEGNSSSNSNKFKQQVTSSQFSSSGAVIMAPPSQLRPSSQHPSKLLSSRSAPTCASIVSILVAIPLILCLLEGVSPVWSSPPVDFLVHTSQYATAKNGEHNITSELHPLESIYFSLADESNRTTTSGPQNNNNDTTKPDLKVLASRVLDIVRDVSHTHSSDKAADLEMVRYAWRLMEKQALAYAQDRVQTIKPFVKALLVESQASRECQESILVWLDRFGALDDWAVMMWNSWGDFPAAGLFEASFTDLGSYKGCLNVRDNAHIGQTQYCTLDFEPILPTRPRFHSIFKQILAVDPKTHQLTGGDFATLQPTADKPRSQTASHAFAASRFFITKLTESQQLKQQATLLATDNVMKFNSSAIEELAKIARWFYYVKLRVGSCWPSKCSSHDIQNIAQSGGAFAVLRATKPFCTMREEKLTDRWNNHQMVAVFILAGLALITVAATCLDIVQDLLFFFSLKRQSKWISHNFNLYIDTYSLCRNMARLFDVSGSKVSPNSVTTTTMTEGKQKELPAKQLTCLHGLKFMSMLWVIYGHTLLFSDYQSYSHPMRNIEGNISDLWTYLSLIPNFSVDTFFVISGLLSAYIIFSLNVKFNGFLYTIARYIRLTPQLFFVILLVFLLPLMGEGPIYKQGTETNAQNCMKNWWLNLFYLQAYVNRKELCLIPSWWLSIEMTFHLISLFIIYLLIKSPKWGMIANTAVIVVMTSIGSIIHYVNGFAIQYLPSIPQKYEIEYEQTQHFFHMPYPHAPSFFIGLALGYVLAKRTIKRIDPYQLYLGWISCAAIFAICLAGSFNWSLGAPYTQLEATLYYNLCQVLWPLGISWIVLTCSLGQGGIVNSILSADFFVPFGRITYMTYLSHMVVVYFYAASIQQPFEPNFLNMTYMCTTNGILSIILGALLSLFYETPLLNIQRIILQRTYAGKSQSQSTMNMTSTANGIRNKLMLNSSDGMKSNNNYHPVATEAAQDGLASPGSGQI